jgi:hypothetical protein
VQWGGIGLDGKEDLVAGDRAPRSGRGRTPTPLPTEINLNAPSGARVYDYFLGGKEHFEIDRQAAEAINRVVPETSQIARDNRNVLRRAVRWLVEEAGIRQIIDVGSGLPTEGNVHELAHAFDPTVRVLYVDIDPIVLAHGRALLADELTTTVIQADIRDADSIFDHPEALDLIDYDQPFAVITAAVLHHLSDADVYPAAEGIRSRLTVGSYLMSSNFLDDDEERARRLEQAFLGSPMGTGRFRTWSELQQVFDGLEMVAPGLVYANDWHPDQSTPTESPVHTLYAAGIGRRADQ